MRSRRANAVRAYRKTKRRSTAWEPSFPRKSQARPSPACFGRGWSTCRWTTSNETPVAESNLNVARQAAQQIEQFPVDINRVIQNTVDSMAPLAETGGVWDQGFGLAISRKIVK